MHADSPRPGPRPTGYALAMGAISLTVMAALAVSLPDAAADPSSEPTTSATASPTAASTAGTASGNFRSDDRGYVGSAARCDTDQVTVAFGRTARALVAICVDRDGELEYRGVRLSDQASVSMPAGRAADGSVVATNDSVTYAVSPTMLLVSEGDNVIYRDAWVEFREPRFADNAPSSPTSSSTSPPTSSVASTATTPPTTTVSTTTVTLAPGGAAGN